MEAEVLKVIVTEGEFVIVHFLYNNIIKTEKMRKEENKVGVYSKCEITKNQIKEEDAFFLERRKVLHVTSVNVRREDIQCR